jgi:RNA polymerase sigma-70 factor (ECF subfamily)
MNEFRDRRLLRRVAEGDQRALAELYERHARLIAMRLRRSGASVTETEDILQETFLSAWNSATGYRGDGPVAAWLWSIARHRLNSTARSAARSRAREVAVTSPSDVRSEEDGWATALDARQAIDRLDPDLRSAFEAVAIEGLSVRSAAARLGVPEGTVKSRVHRARSLLRKEVT